MKGAATNQNPLVVLFITIIELDAAATRAMQTPRGSLEVSYSKLSLRCNVCKQRFGTKDQIGHGPGRPYVAETLCVE
jgi:hypothetical protein